VSLADVILQGSAARQAYQRASGKRWAGALADVGEGVGAGVSSALDAGRKRRPGGSQNEDLADDEDDRMAAYNDWYATRKRKRA
jgi:hypothetical protein